MKQLLNTFMYFPTETATGTPTPTADAPAPKVEKVYTSEKLTSINAELDALLGADISKLDRAGKLAHNLKIFDLTNAEKAEIAGLKKAENEAKAMEARNAKIKTVDDLLEAYMKVQATIGNKKIPMEEANALNDAYHKLRENVVNSILGSKPVVTTTDGEKPAAGSKGATGQKIRELYIAHKAAGMSNTDAEKAIVAAGFSRGTTGAVALAYRKEIGEVK